jgi:glycine C-acetyltransferase
LTTEIETAEKALHEFLLSAHDTDVFDGLSGFLEYIQGARSRDEYSYRRTLRAGSGPTVQVDSTSGGGPREMLLMASNNYLDLATDPRVIQAAAEALRRFGYGSGSVSLLAGTQSVHRLLEEELASFYRRERAVVFPTGYSANVGTIGALAREGDLVLLDMYAHASIVDGTRLGSATVKFFKHNDIDHLRATLKRCRSLFRGVLIATDGVFSMDGDVCDLPGLVAVRDEYGARLMIDEAHAIGVLGNHGLGTEEYHGMQGAVDIVAGTLSKAPAGLGGYVAGSIELTEYLRHLATSYVFSTSLPPPTAGGLIEALRIIREDSERRERVLRNAEYFTRRLRADGFNVGATVTPIVPVILGNERLTRLFARDLDAAGIFVSPVVFPAVAKTQSRLRFSLMSSHTVDQLDRTVDALRRLARSHRVLDC